MHAIRAVAFDLWGTLISDEPASWERRVLLRNDRLIAMLAAAGVRVAPEQLREAQRRGWSDAEVIRDRGGDISSRDQVTRFLEHLELGLAGRLPHDVFDRIAHTYAEALVESPPAMVPGARAALEACRAAGTRTALVSNTGSTPGRVLRRTLSSHGLANLIDVWVFSDEIRLSKPVPDIFRHAVRALGVPPSDCLFVGDTPKLDVVGGKAAGMWVLQVGDKSGDGGPDPDVRSHDLTGFVQVLAAAGLYLAPVRGER